MDRRVICLVVWVAATFSMNGCGGTDRPKTIPISGHITIDGQPPGESGQLYFTPTQAASGYNKRPANGTFNADGTYRVMSWEPDDGLVPGHYTVALKPNDPGATRIPATYQPGGTGVLEVEVPVDQGEVEYNIEITTK